MSEFTPWTLLIDAGMIGALLAVGVLLRAIMKTLQSLLIPASFIAGFLGLALGPNGFGLLPFSEELGTYASVLIVVVFACLAMSDDFDFRKIKGPIVSFSAYGVLIYTAQVAIGVLAVVLLLGPLFNADLTIGTLLFAGWAGGFGTAAALGDVYANAGHEELRSLAFTSATVGLLAGIIGGIIQAKIGATRGHVKEFAGMESIPEDMRTGVLTGEDRRAPIGQHRFSGSSIESLGFQAGIILAIAGAAYGVTTLLGNWFPAVSFPTFTVAFLVGLLVRGLFKAGRATKFVDRDTLSSISGSATDILVVCGIASIQLQAVADNLLVMSLLFVVGLVFCLGLGLLVAPRTLQDGWFEKQIFTWGWATGAVNTAIALLRIVDPKLKSGTLEDFAIAYIPVVPAEITAVTFVPALAMAGLAWPILGIWGGIAAAAAVVLVIVTVRSRSATPAAA